jgi:bile acid:Na+ symporter, BASS family
LNTPSGCFGSHGPAKRSRSFHTVYFQQVGLAALTFNLASMAVGYFVPLLLRVERRQAVAIGMEVGIHNGTLAIAIASSPLLLNDGTMAIPAAIYSLIMFFTAAAFGWIIARRLPPVEPAPVIEETREAA